MVQGSGLWNQISPSYVPANLILPSDYADGTFYQGLQVLTEHEDLKYQICLFQDTIIQPKPAPIVIYWHSPPGYLNMTKLWDGYPWSLLSDECTVYCYHSAARWWSTGLALTKTTHKERPTGRLFTTFFCLIN
ncbi:MAG TPA: hypothetical protein VER35_03210 [Candidatus Limnocylindrales bacterium]|nr:hypothetical protein [Candidatus Limnocylindrales bacterium]